MLVLSRHRDESIMIGDGIEIKVIAIEGGQVRLGIDAAREIPVHRREVYEAIRRQADECARMPPAGPAPAAGGEA